jgi:hypothetical protein
VSKRVKEKWKSSGLTDKRVEKLNRAAAGTKPIALYDSPGVAVFKAGGNVRVLKNVGRDAEGRLIK